MTILWPNKLIWALVHHGHAHLGAVPHAIADRLCHEVGDSVFEREFGR